MSPEAALAGTLDGIMAGADPVAGLHTGGRLGVAVSGGGDSVALMLLLADWARGRGIGLAAVTVDHRLRAGSAAEAAAVAQLCARHGIDHALRTWSGWSGRGNLQAAARRARMQMIADWAAERGIGAVALGHTADDQAETVLMRLARGSGVDGLAGMAVQRQALGIVWLRPLLDVGRDGLRDWLAARGIGWAEDPSNADPRFDRVRARAALAALAPLGIDRAGLVATAGRMRAARAALETLARDTAAGIMAVEAGDVLIDAEGLARAPRWVRERIVAQALCWVAAADYRPRHAALRALMDRLSAAQGGTLHGCLVSVAGGRIRIGREPAAVAGVVAPVGGLWDGRWRLIPPPDTDTAGVEVRALGTDGIAAFRAAQETAAGRRVGGAGGGAGVAAAGLPRATLLAMPAVWRGARLIAAPLAGLGRGWRCDPVPGPARLWSMALSD